MIENAGDPDATTAGRLRLTVAYDGRAYRGWQSQAKGDTVQERLELAFQSLCGRDRIIVHGSGRTDAGVHARGQVAHADVPDPARFSRTRWRAALNAHLPPDIRVRRVQEAPAGFHARFSATGKVYRYKIWNAAVASPFLLGRAWHFPHPLDLSVLAENAKLLLGTHDFAAFSANRGIPPTTTMRTIEAIEISVRGRLLVLDFSGDGFLYKMVRLLTGSLVRCGQGRARPNWIQELVSGREKTSFAAPAEGLYLMRVRYDDQV